MERPFTSKIIFHTIEYIKHKQMTLERVYILHTFQLLPMYINLCTNLLILSVRYNTPNIWDGVYQFFDQ